ncbi:hypothetical protein N7468_003200 [Penicillium chermesinum]|uniref:Uncharacterized protein n=1 Tax=Penicillium chermesinum TaxID=63820 RepID=A0A9W9TRD6_9EURO|nr:uncharacterized protein N7468_003200 [Penicillium chermesinum]KAJ5238581.1 hypothetical protein N7468_003200 [Penicillium chermesinum]
MVTFQGLLKGICVFVACESGQDLVMELDDTKALASALILGYRMPGSSDGVNDMCGVSAAKSCQTNLP